MGLSKRVLSKWRKINDRTMSYVKYNKTSTFLFPLLNIPKGLFYCNVKNSFGDY
jgi:hypothetical protein